MKSFKGGEKNLEINLEKDGELVELLEDWRDVLSGGGWRNDLGLHNSEPAVKLLKAHVED